MSDPVQSGKEMKHFDACLHFPRILSPVQSRKAKDEHKLFQMIIGAVKVSVILKSI